MVLNQQSTSSNRYQVIPRTLIFPRYEDKILLIKGAKNKKLWANLYNGLGGHIERGEDALSAAYREVFEESGLQNIILHLCGTVFIDTGPSTGICLFVFLGICQELEVKESREGKLSWTPGEQISRLPVVPDIPIILPRVLAWKQGDTPFYACYTSGSDGKLVVSFGEPHRL
jgi:8-oxo-dGTP diphosphatase